MNGGRTIVLTSSRQTQPQKGNAHVNDASASRPGGFHSERAGEFSDFGVVGTFFASVPGEYDVRQAQCNAQAQISK